MIKSPVYGMIAFWLFFLMQFFWVDPPNAVAGKCEGTVVSASWFDGSNQFDIQIPFAGLPDEAESCLYQGYVDNPFGGAKFSASVTLYGPASNCGTSTWGTCGCPVDTPYRWFFDFNDLQYGHYFGPCDTMPSTIGPDGDYLSGGYDTNTFIIQISGGASTVYGVNPSSNGKSATVGDPINAKTRSYYFYIPIFDLEGPLPVTFSLAYQSYSPIDGAGFVTSVPRIKRKSSVEIYVSDWNGGLDIISFTWDAEKGRWMNHNDNPYVYALQEQSGANGWFYLMDPLNQYVYLFEKNSFEDTDLHQEARLRFLMDRNGNIVTHTYSCWDCASGATTINDGLGREITLTVSDAGNLARVSDGVRNYDLSYNTYGQLIKITDPSGGAASFEYSSDSGPLVRKTLPMGNTPYVQAYDTTDESRVAAQTDALGNTTSLTVVPNATQTGDRVLETRPDGSQSGYEHSSSGASPLFVIDNTGSAVTFSVNENDKITSATDRLGDTIIMTYHDETGLPSSFTNAKGDRVSHIYTAQEQSITNPADGKPVNFTFYNLTRNDYPDGSFEVFGFDAKGNRISHTDRNGNTATFTYNDRGQVLTITNAIGGVQSYTYNQDATMASSRDSDTGETTYTYDGFRRLIIMNDPGPGQTDIQWDEMNRITGITDENGHSFQYAYDGNGNLTRVTDPIGNATQYAYDKMDRIQQITDRTGSVTSFAYDFRGEITQVTDANNLKTSFIYNDRGWLSGMQSNDAGYLIGRDAEGVQAGLETPLGLKYREETDKLGFLTAVTFPGGETVQVKRDSMTRITSGTDPFGDQTLFDYDKEDFLSRVEQPDGAFATFRRDALGNLGGIIDFNGQEWTFNYTGMGRLISMSDPLSRTTSYTLDALGRVDTAAFPGGESEARGYDAAGNLIQRTYSSGVSLFYTYDDMNNLIATNDLTLVRDMEERIIETTFNGRTFGVTYDAGGRITTAGYGNIVVSYTYNDNDLLSGVSDTTGAWVNFIYDGDGRLIKLERSNDVNADLTWDGSGRLSRIQDGGFMDLSYSYDLAGRVSSINGTWPIEMTPLLQSITVQSVSVDAASQIESSGYMYDGRGRATAIPGHALAWNEAGRLIGYNEITLAYNGLGEIISRTENGVTSFNYYNHGLGQNPLIAEQQNGQFTRYYVYTPTGRLLYSLNPLKSDAVAFYHFDHTGSALALSDGSGNVTDRYAYAPYGEMLSHKGESDQPFTYVGMLGVRKEGDIYQMHQRYYDPKIGRFLSREPIWPTPGNHKALNPYQYAYQSPLVYADPTGGWIILIEAWAELFIDAMDPKNHTEGVAHGNWADNIWNTATYRDLYKTVSDTVALNVEQNGKELLKRQKEAYRQKRMRGFRETANKNVVKSAIRIAGNAAGAGEKEKNVWQKAAETKAAKGSVFDKLNQRRKKYNNYISGDYNAFDYKPPEKKSTDSGYSADEGTTGDIEKKKTMIQLFQSNFKRMSYSGSLDTP